MPGFEDWRQTLGMAALVTTMLYVPVGAVLGVLSFALLGTSPHEFITFGESFNAFGGLALWWLAAFVPALAYAVLCTPT
jgi:hypothetical protein